MNETKSGLDWPPIESIDQAKQLRRVESMNEFAWAPGAGIDIFYFE